MMLDNPLENLLLYIFRDFEPHIILPEPEPSQLIKEKGFERKNNSSPI